MLVAFAIIAAIVQGMILVIICGLLYLVVKQQGRLLLRLDQIDGALGIARLEADQSNVLQVGEPISEFHLPDLDGRMVSPEDFRGKQVLLVHWGPNCGFCELIAPDLARLNGELIARGGLLVLASRDKAEANRTLADEHGLECPILLMNDDDPLATVAFKNQGTPVAYLLDDQGKVASPLVMGGEAILSLAQGILGETAAKKRLPGERPLSESKLVRDGIKAGTVAPLFSLPDLNGETIELEEYRGRQVVLIFTDPHCGPCDELAPHLAKLQHRCDEEGLQLILVGRGEVDENRTKAESHGFEFPVVLQDRWKLSKEYGIFAVPVAFLVGEDGVIAANVARGVDEILALVRQGLATGKALSRRGIPG